MAAGWVCLTAAFTWMLATGQPLFTPETFARVPFNLYANRYYLELKDSSGDVIVYTPLIASPDNYDINLALPCSPGKLVFRESSNQFEVS